MVGGKLGLKLLKNVIKLFLKCMLKMKIASRISTRPVTAYFIVLNGFAKKRRSKKENCKYIASRPYHEHIFDNLQGRPLMSNFVYTLEGCAGTSAVEPHTSKRQGNTFNTITVFNLYGQQYGTLKLGDGSRGRPWGRSANASFFINIGLMSFHRTSIYDKHLDEKQSLTLGKH